MQHRSIAERVVPRVVAFALVLLAAAACASVGRDFPRMDPGSLVFGQTTISEVLAKYGPPYSRTRRSSDSPSAGSQVANDELPAGMRRASIPGDIESLTYVYAHAASTGVTMAANSRLLALSFWNDKLISYSYISNFAEDSTNFDESRLSSFVRGTTTRTDIQRELGRPGGEGVYPFVANPGNRTLSYQYVSNTKSSGFISRTTETSSKTVRFLFDPSDRLIEIYTSTRENSTRRN
jgi:hypothetical protein